MARTNRLGLRTLVVLEASAILCNSQSPTVIEYSLPSAPAGPATIISGPDGNLWFTETAGNKIGRISPQGVLNEFPISTPNSAPNGITSGPDGNVWITEALGNKIGKILPTGAIIEYVVPTRASQPYSIVSGPDGNLWFTEFAANQIGSITTAGVITEFSLPAFSGPTGIAAGTDGNLWFSENLAGKIGRLTTSGQITEFALPNASSGPTAITAGPDGNLWFVESANFTIARITATGVIAEFTVPAALNSITARSDGLWFTDSDNRSLGRITTVGTISEFPIPTPDSSPTAVTRGPDGNIWFTEGKSNKIGMLSVSLPSVSVPTVDSVANAFGDSQVIGRNTWVAIKGSNLAPKATQRTWQGSDFSDGLMPTVLDGVRVRMSGTDAYIYYVSENQLNVLTPTNGSLINNTYVQVSLNGVAGRSSVVHAEINSPSLFVYNGGPYVIAVHADESRIGPTNLVPGLTTPAKPGEVVVLFGNGFGGVPVQPGSIVQSGRLDPPPGIDIGGVRAIVQFAGLISPGLYQFNVVIPPGTLDGDNSIVAAYGALTQPGTLITVQH